MVEMFVHCFNVGSLQAYFHGSMQSPSYIVRHRYTRIIKTVTHMHQQPFDCGSKCKSGMVIYWTKHQCVCVCIFIVQINIMQRAIASVFSIQQWTQSTVPCTQNDRIKYIQHALRKVKRILRNSRIFFTKVGGEYWKFFENILVQGFLRK